MATFKVERKLFSEADYIEYVQKLEERFYTKPKKPKKKNKKNQGSRVKTVQENINKPNPQDGGLIRIPKKEVEVVKKTATNSTPNLPAVIEKAGNNEIIQVPKKSTAVIPTGSPENTVPKKFKLNRKHILAGAGIGLGLAGAGYLYKKHRDKKRKEEEEKGWDY